jgi:hypothetical protein
VGGAAPAPARSRGSPGRTKRHSAAVLDRVAAGAAARLPDSPYRPAGGVTGIEGRHPVCDEEISGGHPRTETVSGSESSQETRPATDCRGDDAIILDVSDTARTRPCPPDHTRRRGRRTRR